ncbi:MAG: DUF3060 domain-containing protein [Vicinamibacteraceae bacterium]
MRLDLRVGTIAAASALCLPVVAFGQRPVVEGMSQRLTVACGTEGAKVQGAGNTVTLTGACSTVLVEGSDNTVHIAMLGRLTVAGMNNKVYWTSGIDGAAPKVTKEGMGNSVEKKTPADSGAPAAKPQTSTPSTGSGTASATASTPTSSAAATAKPGNPTLAVGSGDRRVAMGASGSGASMSAKRGDPAPAKPATSSTRTASATGTGLPILVPTNQQVKTMECEGRAVSVQGNGNRLTLKGQCGPVTVGGNENILDVGSTTRIDTSGNRNVVKYRELVNDKAPVVSSGGTGNRVSKVEPQ